MTIRILILPQARRDIDRNAECWAEHHSVDQINGDLESVMAKESC